MTSLPARSVDRLSSDELRKLEDADRRLRAAVAGYERFLGQELKAGQPVPVRSAQEVAATQVEVEASERELWRLREELLGWVRPSWAPPAALVADWFSEDDAVYDEVEPASSR